MTIGRSLTKKASRYGLGNFGSSSDAPPRSPTSSKRNSITKPQISAPVALISTTNMISYTSPMLRTSGSISSFDSSNSSPTSWKFPSSPLSSGEETEASSPDDLYSLSPLPNHLSTYFSTSPSRSNSAKSTTSSTSTRDRRRTTAGEIAPLITASSGRNSNGKPLHSSSTRNRASARASASAGLINPFGAELAKVAEIAEDLGFDVGDAEETFMIERGLQKFSAADYTREIGAGGGFGMFSREIPMFGTAGGASAAAGWI